MIMYDNDNDLHLDHFPFTVCLPVPLTCTVLAFGGTLKYVKDAFVILIVYGVIIEDEKPLALCIEA